MLLMRLPIRLPFAVTISCEFLSMVANTRRAFIAATKFASFRVVPVGSSTPVRLV